ncbi:MAG: hypothetical protein LBU10_04795, partial [Endomicrobium sp.]|nr:hypothetical protein [Endomicrobium sp.]
MATERLVKWSKEAQEFFEKAEDNSIVLDLVISYACASQTGEGFEELANSINSPGIKRKVKKVIITDTSYLYRHDIPDFAKYVDPTIPTKWYLKNKEAIEKLTVPTELKSWASGIDTNEFKKWYKKIMVDFAGDENGNNMVLDFRDKVMQEASVAAYKNNANILGCIGFILEKITYACAHFKDVSMVYPSDLAKPVEDASERYNLSIAHLRYKLSKQAQQDSKCVDIDLDALDKKIMLFMKEKVPNVNFFVIDKYGNHIYKNYALDRVIGEKNAKQLSNESWKNTLKVIKSGEERIFEEEFRGIQYLSFKYPFVIDGIVEGVIGLGVDITERKKAEGLEKKLAIVKELYEVERMLVDDICSPGLSLYMLHELCKDR